MSRTREELMNMPYSLLKTLYGVVTDKYSREEMIEGILKDEEYCDYLRTVSNDDLQEMLAEMAIYNFNPSMRHVYVAKLCDRFTTREVTSQKIMDRAIEDTINKSYATNYIPARTNSTVINLHAVATYIIDRNGAAKAVLWIAGDVSFVRKFLEPYGASLFLPCVMEMVDTPANRELVATLFENIARSLKHFVHAELVVEPTIGDNGVIGWETSFVVPDWIDRAVPGSWPASQNPVRRGRILTFGVCGLNVGYVNCILSKLTSVTNDKGDLMFPDLHDKMIQMAFVSTLPVETVDKFVDKIASLDGKVVVVAWNAHARVLAQFGDKIWGIVDSHRSVMDADDTLLAEAFTRKGLELFLYKKQVDQGYEGSCSIHAVCRAAFIARNANFDDPIPDDIAVLVDRLSKVCFRRIY